MLNLPSFIPAKRRKRRKRKQAVQPVPAPPVGLTLVSAVYDNVALTLTLGFDRAIDISGYNPEVMELDDGTFNSESYLVGKEPGLVDAQTVQIDLEPLTSDSEPGVYLSAPDNTGIVAVDGSGEWAGVSELALPFG
jgi:hypothetical protein